MGKVCVWADRGEEQGDLSPHERPFDVADYDCGWTKEAYLARPRL